MQYLFISGTSTDGRFLVNLSKPIILEGEYSVGLIDIKFEKPTSSVYMLCSLCNESVYNESILPIIRRVDGKSNVYSHPIFHKLVIKELNSFYLYFKNTDWSDINASFSTTLCLKPKSINTS